VPLALSLERQFLSALSQSEQKSLDTLLTKLSRHMDRVIASGAPMS